MNKPPIAYHTDTLQHCHLARVVSVDDPQNLARVKVRMLSLDQSGDAELWARVASASAGNRRGALFIPDVDDEVLVGFIAGDPRFPVVLGGLWNGRDQPPEQPGPSRVKRWTLTGKAGTRIAIVEEDGGQTRIELQTPAGQSLVLNDADSSITASDSAGNQITLKPEGILVQSASKVTVEAAQVKVTAGQVQVDAAMSNFNGTIRCDTLISTSVVATSYTPGAGNVW